MSWRLLLSEYPDALLTDQLAMLILVLLERGGLVTESELQQELEVDPPATVQKLLALHRDKCIEYSRNHVRITDRGRQLIDRFALNGDIVDDLLDGLPLSAERRDLLKTVIIQYRQSAFDQYLKSVKAVRSWYRASRLPAVQDGAQPDSTGVGSLAILLSDMKRLRNDEFQVVHHSGHGTHVAPVAAAFDKLEEQLPDDDATKRAFDWLVNLEESNTPWKHVGIGDTGLGIFAAFQFSRYALETTHWLDEWSDNGRCIVILNACNSGREALNKVGDHWLANWLDESRSWRDKVQGHVRERNSGRLPFGNIADLLMKLLAASSLEELMRTTNLSRESLEVLLAQIRTKCDTLLGKEFPDDVEGEEKSRLTKR